MKYVNTTKVSILTLAFFFAKSVCADDQLQGKRVTVGGFTSSPGIIVLEHDSSVISFLIRNKLIRADSRMQNLYVRGETLKQYKIKIIRDRELLEIDFKGGSSFANTIPILSGDVIEIVLTDQFSVAEWRNLDMFLGDIAAGSVPVNER